MGTPTNPSTPPPVVLPAAASQRDRAVRAKASPLTQACLVDLYRDTHQPTVYADGRFWRCTPAALWQPLSHRQVAAEILALLSRSSPSVLTPSARSIAALTELLRIRLDSVPAGRWDNPAGALPLRNGLLNLTTGTLTPYQPSHFIATALPYAYDPHAQAPAWQSFLDAAVPDAVSLLQEFIGYCLTPDTSHGLCLWLLGAQTHARSTFLHGLQVLFGPYTAELYLDDLTRRRLAPAAFAGKQLLISREPPANPAFFRPLNALVTGEPLTFAPPHGQAQPFRLTAKLILAFDTLPSQAEYLHTTIPGALPVDFASAAELVPAPALRESLSREGPGLLNWALAGLRRLVAHGGFQAPSYPLATLKSMRLAHEAPTLFIEECCQRDSRVRTQAQLLHVAYVTWCALHNIPSLSARALAAEWQRHGFERTRVHGVSHWCGLALRPIAETPLAAVMAAHAAANPAPKTTPSN